MKSNFLKIGLPMAVVAFGLASAAGTSSLRADSAAPIPGYARDNSTAPCDLKGECDDQGNEICTAPDNPSLVLNAQFSNCTVPLKRL